MLPRITKHLSARIFFKHRLYTTPTPTNISYPNHVKRALLLEKAWANMRDAASDQPNKLETMKRIKREILLTQLKAQVAKGELLQEEAALLGDMVVLEETERRELLGDIPFPFSTNKLDTLAAALTERSVNQDFKTHIMALKYQRDEIKHRLGTQVQNLKNTPGQDLENLSRMEKQYQQQLKDVENRIGKIPNDVLQVQQGYILERLESIKTKFYELLETKLQPKMKSDPFDEQEDVDQYVCTICQYSSFADLFFF